MRNSFILLLAIIAAACNNEVKETKIAVKDSTTRQQPGFSLDTAKYYQLLVYLANGDTSGRWPVKNQPLPLPGAVLPFSRIVAYYGNLYSNKMGALGKW